MRRHTNRLMRIAKHNRARQHGAFTWTLSLAVLLTAIWLSLPLLAEDNPSSESVQTALFPSIVVSFEGEISPGVAIELDASASSHDVPEGFVSEVRYLWDLGDGTMRMGNKVTHRYTTAGIFQISLTMEVFESSGIFHRNSTTTEVTVDIAPMPRFVTVINVETGFTYPGVLIQLQDPYVLIEKEIESTTLPGDQPQALSPLPSTLNGFILSGGILSVGELRLWDARIAMELPAAGWLGFVGFGVSVTEASISLTELYPAVESEGYNLVSVIDQANLITLGVGYEITSNLYLLGSLGSLYVAGDYEGSSRLIVNNELLSASFADRMTTLSLGLGLRLSWAMLSFQVLLTL